MFKDDDSDDWRPYYTYKRRKGGRNVNGNGSAAAQDGAHGKDEDDYEWVEDPDSTESAVYPIQGE
jgi:actin-related protein 9